MIRFLPLAALLAAGLAAPAAAETRSYTITSFDRVRIDGPYTVTITTNSGSFARATGSAAAIDRVKVRVEGTTLIVSVDPGGWGGSPDGPAGPVAIEAGTGNLAIATVNGAGSLTASDIRGPEFALNMQGSGIATIQRLDVDRLKIGVAGAGSARLGGQALNLTAIVRGAGSIDAAGVNAHDATIGAEGPALVRATVSGTAKVDATGVAAVTLAGDPGCQSKTTGTATITGCREQVGRR
ncbi:MULTISPECIES: GIN domain-containing protein [Sphingomonas]|uniref:GIN domain-containing protein n=1 Tax=Sphingomonas TaxID=13687 RepID=UPI000DEEFD03|nr:MULTISPECIES: DUF2807 domain-containing protein [Sphingomonas]